MNNQRGLKSEMFCLFIAAGRDYIQNVYIHVMVAGSKEINTTERCFLTPHGTILSD
jgi:hypothetical protein